MTATRQPRPALVSAAPHAMLFVWVMLGLLLWPVTADPDLWGHLKFGEDIVRSRSVHVIDPYSFTSDLPWINHEWLSEAQMAIVFGLAGTPGLIGLKLLLVGVAAGLLAMRIQALPFAVKSGLVVLTAWACAPLVVMMRPQLWSFALTALVAFALTAARPRRALPLLPPLFMFWINCHGGWIIGAWLVGVWALFEMARPQARGAIVVTGILTVAALLVNPYGVELLRFMARTVSVQRDIQEWRPLTQAGPMEVVPWAATVLVVVISQISASRRRWSSVVTLGYLAYASFEVVRVIPFFAIATAFFSAKPLEALSARWRWMRWEPKAPSDTAAALALAPTLLLSAMLLTNAAPRARCISISGAWVPDPLIGAALQSARPAGTLVTSFGWGQYGIWHLGPQLRVSLDGRRETVYSDERMERLWEIEAGERKSLPLLASLRPDYVWLPTREETDGVRSWLVDHGYRLDLSTGKSWLVSRQELPPVQPSPAPASSCFPG